jgi:trehalose/maltose transport system substrate-binding protein
MGFNAYPFCLTVTPYARATEFKALKRNVTLYHAPVKGEHMTIEGTIRRALNRRAFLLGAIGATAAGVLAACSQPAQPAATTAPAAAPPPTAKPAGAASPAASPASGASPSASPSAAAAASPAVKPAASPAASPAAGAPSVAAANPPAVPANILTAAKAFAGQKVVYYGDGIGASALTEKGATDQFAKDTGIQIVFTQRPSDSTEALALFQRFFQGQSSDIDAMSIDVVWPGVLAPHLLDFSQKLGDEAKNHYPGIIANNTVGGKLVAMPYFSDFGMLYYRTDLLQKYSLGGPPKTWDELQQQAAKIVDGEKAANPNFAGFVFQGKAYEGLTCDALEWIASSGGGTIVDSSGKVTVNNPQAAAILNTVKGWIGNIVPRGVTSYGEEEARTTFGGGNAAFMRNWPYAYAPSQAADSAIRGKFDIAPLPAQPGGKSSGTIGGWGMAVSKYSKVPDAATQLVRYMVSPEVQTFRAIAGGFVPTIQSVAENPDVNQAMPYLKTVATVERVGRPAGAYGDNYNQASTAFFQGVSQILGGQEAAQVLPGVAQKLTQLLS